MSRRRMRFKVPDDLWNLLSRLADHAKIDWFYLENIRKVTVSRSDVESLSSAFISENLWGFNDDECLQMYEFFTEVEGKHSPYLAAELCNRIRRYNRDGYQ